MPEFGIHVDVDDVVAALQDKIAKISDLRPAWKRAESVVIDMVRRNFLAGGKPTWAPLKDKKLGRRPLVGTGELLARATHPLLALSKDGAVFVAPVGAAGMVHQFGFSGNVTVSEHFRDGRGAKKSATVRSHTKRMEIPARPYFIIPHGTSDVSRIELLVQEYVMRG